MISVGTDILKIDRVEAVVERLGDKFMRRILTEDEQLEYHSSAQSIRLLAKRFAVKEAVAKALGTGVPRRGVSRPVIVHKILEAGGIEPPSRDGFVKVSTCVVACLSLDFDAARRQASSSSSPTNTRKTRASNRSSPRPKTRSGYHQIDEGGQPSRPHRSHRLGQNYPSPPNAARCQW